MRKARKPKATGQKNFFYIKPQILWFGAKLDIILAACNQFNIF